MPNAWSYDAPNTLVFENASKSQVLTLTNNNAGEWTVHLTKSGVDKGTLLLDSVADIKDMFQQVGAEL
jgi:PKD repeat protein